MLILKDNKYDKYVPGIFISNVCKGLKVWLQKLMYCDLSC